MSDLHRLIDLYYGEIGQLSPERCPLELRSAIEGVLDALEEGTLALCELPSSAADALLFW